MCEQDIGYRISGQSTYVAFRTLAKDDLTWSGVDAGEELEWPGYSVL